MLLVRQTQHFRMIMIMTLIMIMVIIVIKCLLASLVLLQGGDNHVIDISEGLYKGKKEYIVEKLC